MSYFLVVIGLAVLVFGGNLLVRGASGLALVLKIPAMLVGMTVVALGTSAPELVVSLQAALVGKPDISIGNVIGSNLANVALILGVTCIIFPITVKKDSLKFDWVAMMVASIAVYLLMLDGSISRMEGIGFVVALSAFIFYSFRREIQKPERRENLIQDLDLPRAGYGKLIFFVLLGSVGLIVGASWFLEGAESVAKDFGISDRVIAITLVAFGTSVPELAASIIAAFKKQEDISLGNIIGSNLFNLLAILGITATVFPIKVSPQILSNDIFWMLGTSFAIFPLAIAKLKLSRLAGCILLASYITFVILLLR